MKRPLVAVTVITLIGLAGVACGPENAEPTASPATSSAAATTPAPESAPQTPNDQTIFEYLDKHGAQVEWLDQQTLTDLRIEQVVPPKWQQTESADVPNAYAIWARTGLPDGQYVPRAMALVGRLTAPVDAKDAIRYGFVDAERLPGWQRNDASLDDFGGFPSSLIEGTYMRQGAQLAISNRYILANTADAQYFIQYSITMTLPQAKEYGPDAKQLKQGFTVTPR